MRYVSKRIFLALIAGLLIMPLSVFAGGFQQVEIVSEGNPVATKPFVPEEDTSFSGQAPLPGKPESPDNKPDQSENFPVISEALSEQEVRVVVDDVVSRMADEGFGRQMSVALTYISAGDYQGLVNSESKSPEFLNEFIQALEKVSAGYSGDTRSKGYVDRWLENAYQVQKSLQADGDGSSDDLAEAVTMLYKPIAKRMSEIAKSFEETKRDPGNGVKEPSSGDLLKNFSGKAREFILDSFSRAQANLADGMLSNPLEATAFAAEAAPVAVAVNTPEEMITRKMTLAEEYQNGRGRRYQIIDSVFIGKDFIRTQKYLNPPENLHPYLKWLLYTRNLTPRMVENYLATREAVGAIYEQAKAGRGNIRYRDKVYGAFLPFAETAPGNYELVKPASAE